jgi:tRNA threonylcarbamoyladenosine biosynthesis protein TsaB
MRLLAVDTSTWWGGAALLERANDGSIRVVAECGVWVEDSHAARLLPAIEALLALAGWEKGALTAYAATRGPGSFTGIRVGLGLLTGLALATGRPCAGISTLEAMAEAHGPENRERIPLMDAGRGEVYGARFDPASSPPRETRVPWVGDPAAALAGLSPEGVVIFGAGATAHAARLREAGYAGAIGGTPSSVAAAAGRIACEWLAAAGAPQIGLSPLYVRPADAEIKFR